MNVINDQKTKYQKILLKPMAPLLLFLLFLQVYPSVSECHLSNDDTSPLRRNVYGNGKIIDITHRITPEMVVYGSGGVGLGQFLWLKKSIKKGNNSNSSFMKLSVHTGTHVDAPGHFIDSDFYAGFDVDNLDLDVLNGNKFTCMILSFSLDSSLHTEF